MATQDKALLLQQVQRTLHPRMFANLLDEAMTEINGHLDGYDITHIAHGGGSDDLLKTFINAKRVEGKSEKTLTLYSYEIGRFLDYAKVSVRDVTTYHVRDYLAAEQARGLADTTVNNCRQILSSFFGWLDAEKLIPSNPIRNVCAIKCRKQVKEAFSDADIERLKMNCKNVRNLAIISFLLSTGCRISEMVALDRNDLDLVNMECTVLGKGNKERTVYISEVAAMMIREYLATRTDSDRALFAGERGRLTPGGVRQMLKKLAMSSGVDNVHPHRFRRTMITNLLNRGMAIQEVCVIAGHDKTDTTFRYFDSKNARIKHSYMKYSI